MTPEGVRISHLPVTLQNVYVTLFFLIYFLIAIQPEFTQT